MPANGLRAQLSRMFGRAFAAGSKAVVRDLQRTRTRPSTEPAPSRPSSNRPSSPRPAPPRRTAGSGSAGAARGESSTTAYAGDFTGKAKLQYAPQDDGNPDPGEVVWAWVPFEEDHSQGKDRPVLVIARSGADLLGLMLTSKDHTGDQRPPRADGPVWLDLGVGAWDRQGRPSEVRLDRVLRLAPSAVRREGATLDRARFDRVVAAMRARLGS